MGDAVTPSGSGAGQVTEPFPLTPDYRDAPPAARRRHRAPWVIAVVVVLAAAGVGVAITEPFASRGAGAPAAAGGPDPTGSYVVDRQDLSSQTQVAATLGYAGSYTIASPSGTSAADIAQAQQAVTEDQQTLSADEQAESDTRAADAQAIADARSDVSSDQSTLAADEATESQDCAGTGSSSPACSQDEQKVSQDQSALTQARQQLATAQSAATLDQDQDQAKVQADETKLQGDQATLASLQASAANPGTTYTWLPAVGAVIRQDQPVYAVSDEPVPLLYGPIPAYRAFYVGMSDGADVGELTRDLITLGYGEGLTQSNSYSAATADAVERWQRARGLPVTGQILLGDVVFEPGPIRVTSVNPSVGQPVGAGGNGAGAGGTVLTATSTTRQVSIALDASDQSEVAVGDKVSITLPDNEATPGVVSSVGTVATAPAAGSPDTSPTITVLVNPTDPAATGTWDQAPVTVTITTGTVDDALVVPVDALRALPAGGYAVEVVSAGGTHRMVPVSLGLFDDADGLVQVSGTSLAAGQRVVVPNL